MLKQNILLPVTAFLLLCTSCNKDDDGGNCSLNASSLKGTYKVTSQLEDGEETIDDLEPCERDDTYKFDGSNITFTDAGEQCQGSVSESFAYTLNGTTLTIHYDATDTDVYTVSNFTCDSFELVMDGDIIHFERQ